MTSPWSNNEDLTAALMYARTTALITALQTTTAVGAWVAVTNSAGYTGTGFQARLDGSGQVRLQGRSVKNTGSYPASTWVTVGTLPSAAYAPSRDVQFRVTAVDPEVGGALRIDSGSTSIQVYAPAGSTVNRFYLPAEWST